MAMFTPSTSLFSEGFARFIHRDPRVPASGLDPEDVVSDLALAILNSPLKAPVRGVRLRWLYLDILRRGSRQRANRARLAPPGDVVPTVDLAFDLTDWATGLAPEQRDAVRLVAWLGHTLEEAGEKLGVCPATVLRRLRTARRQARELAE